jgi:hypothetical protein
MEFNMFWTKQLAMTALVAVALSQPFAQPAYSAPALSDQAVDDVGVSSLQLDRSERPDRRGDFSSQRSSKILKRPTARSSGVR